MKKERKKYKVKATIDYYMYDELYDNKEVYGETWAESEKKAINNVRYNLIGKKYNTVDHDYSSRTEVYTFEIIGDE